MNFARLTHPIIIRGIDSIVFVSLGIYGYWELIVLAILWGASLALAMRDGVDQAPEENWRPSETSPFRFLVSLVLIGLIFGPCVVVALGWGIFPAVASAWLVWFGFGLMITILRHIRGPIVIPHQKTCGNTTASQE